jgi:hypothetical protein
MVPNILVLLALPATEAEWLTVSAEQLILRRCAYWASLKELPESQNKDTVTIYINDTYRFDVEGLKALMERARTGAVA